MCNRDRLSARVEYEWPAIHTGNNTFLFWMSVSHFPSDVTILHIESVIIFLHISLFDNVNGEISRFVNVTIEWNL